MSMTETEAKDKANVVMSIRSGAGAAPTSEGLFRSVGGRSTWTFHYKGFMVVVSDEDGTVSVFEEH